ncbi:unnamed protein product, partial [Hapterophycus canaliculatus]
NEKQAVALRLVVDRAAELEGYRTARNYLAVGAMGPLPCAPQPLRMFLTGTTGTGKTVVIREMVKALGRQRFKLLAPTGNAACAIEGDTIHSGLRIPVQNRRSADPSQLSEGARADLQQRMNGVGFLLVDEFCMQAVEGRRRGRDDDRHLDIFGGLIVIPVGAPMQLPPVGASPMWATRPATGVDLSVQGLHAWLSMNDAVELTQVMRQLGPEQATFRATLLRVAEGTQTEADWDVMRARFTSTVSGQEAASFHTAVHIFPTNELAQDSKWQRLHLLGTPIAKINADHSVPGYAAVSSDRFRGLAATVFLAVGARVFINNNVCVSAGLAKGAIGEVL